MPTGVITVWLEYEYEGDQGEEECREVEATANVREWMEMYGADADGNRGEKLAFREISDLKITWVDSGEDVPKAIFNELEEEMTVDIEQQELTR
jgi:hypothetical protein